MDVDINYIFQALPIVASGMTALIVYIKKGVSTDIDMQQLVKDMKQVKDSLVTYAIDIAVLKAKVEKHDS